MYAVRNRITSSKLPTSRAGLFRISASPLPPKCIQTSRPLHTTSKMSHPVKYNYTSPLAGYENAAPLSEEKNADGKSLVNPPRDGLSGSYERFPVPLDNGRRGGFDIHIYHFQNNEAQAKYAHELWERIRREFPELRVYRFWDKPVGPHPIAMFEVNLFTPVQFGAFIPWLAVNRGPLSVLVHPNTEPGEGETKTEAELRDHSERAIWMGERVPLNYDLFLSVIEKEKSGSA